MREHNCLSRWFPLIERAGLPIPKTAIVRTSVDLIRLLDGERPEGFDGLLAEIETAAATIPGPPWFLRTGQTSGKHDWKHNCFLESLAALPRRLYGLVEFSECADVFGLPYDVFAVRELISTRPLFLCEGFGGFPLTREFRFFATPDEVTHVQPYWPPDAVEQGNPSESSWRELLAASSRLTAAERESLSHLAIRAAAACSGHWSVDFLQAADGSWWLTDMATAETSYRWDVDEAPEEREKETR